MSSSVSAMEGDGGFPSPRFESQSFGSFSSSYVEEDAESSSSVKGVSHVHQPSYSLGDDGHLFGSHQISEPPLPSVPGFSPEGNGTGPIHPPPEVGVALREWRRQNAIRLEEKEKREKEILNGIIKEAEEHKSEFYRKWKVRVENKKDTNREKEKVIKVSHSKRSLQEVRVWCRGTEKVRVEVEVQTSHHSYVQEILLENQEKFHAEASQNYWKAAAEMIPREVPTIEKKGKKKEPSIVVIHGPKPGKPADLSRMRQVFLKLKHRPPPHMNPPTSTPSSLLPSSIPGKDGKAGASSSVSSAPSAPKSVTAE